MSAISYVHQVVIPATLSVLPPRMRNKESHALMLAVGLQESRFEYRFQVGGPAHGFWQFEAGGGWKGVMNHAATRDTARALLKIMSYGEPDVSDYKGIAHNDILACALARLLLFTHPKRLPVSGEHQYAWGYYVSLWRPGKPHRETWDTFYNVAWNMVESA